MNKEQLQQRVAKVEAELAELKSELNKPEKDEWPKKGGKYWRISGYGCSEEIRFENDCSDRGAKSIGNMFRTKEEAEHRLEQLKLIQELREFGGDEGEYYLWYNNGQWGLSFGYAGLVQFPIIKRVEEAISHFGDRLNILLPKK